MLIRKSNFIFEVREEEITKEEWKRIITILYNVSVIKIFICTYENFVCLCKNIDTNTKFVCKVIRLYKGIYNTEINSFKKISQSKQSSPYLVKANDICKIRCRISGTGTVGKKTLLNFMSVQLDYYPFTLLQCNLENVDEEQKKIWSIEILKAVRDFHSITGYYHGDIKPDNICIDESLHIKLIDYGLADYNSNDMFLIKNTTRDDTLS